MKLQTRKAISVRGTTYQRVRLVAADRGESMSDFVEAAISQRCKVLGLAPPPPAPRGTPKPLPIPLSGRAVIEAPPRCEGVTVAGKRCPFRAWISNKRFCGVHAPMPRPLDVYAGRKVAQIDAPPVAVPSTSMFAPPPKPVPLPRVVDVAGPTLEELDELQDEVPMVADLRELPALARGFRPPLRRPKAAPVRVEIQQGRDVPVQSGRTGAERVRVPVSRETRGLW